VKINESDVLNILKPQSGNPYDPVTTGRAPGTTEPGAVSPNDGIDLGSQSGLLTYAQQAGSAERQDRVQELRALVQSGQYQLDSPALSQSIVSAASNGY
jgi:anti-sigma28 factor (negative regulator of flagellin synthesis)